MRISTKKIVLTALMIALVFLITYLPFLHLPSPIPPGYFNIGDAAVMIAAILLGRRVGFAAGAIGSAVADLVYAAFFFAPITFIVKGVEGYVVGVIANSKSEKVPVSVKRIVALIIGALLMPAGYFFFEITVYRLLFDKTLAVAAIISELPGNLLQGAVSAVVAYVFVALLDKTKIFKNLNQ